ncbi:hypothetical protein Q3G72_035383 [Acer saccharum]|nr:hypothetical protein Q3G72_035383 [Acer saccharum]
MESVVLYPMPARGHLISAVELAKLILTQNPSLIINIILTNPPIKLGPTAPFVAAVSSAIPSIKFHHLPTVPVDPDSYPSHRAILFDHYRLVNPHFRQVLRSLSGDFTLRCLVIDFFCFPALHIASELNIPTYYFFTSGASCLALFLHLPTIYENTTQSFKDLENTFVDLSFMPPVPLSHMPESTLVRGTPECLHIINCAAHLKKSAGIIVNTFESLEPKAVKALSNGNCILDHHIPPVYCIGPLTITTDQSTGDSTTMECLTWLDSQPSQSVVFVCFGSMGLLSKQQLRELGLGLERSYHRFLWVVRNPPSDTQSKDPIAQPDPDLNLLLPDGFLDRTRDRGLVVKSWAPQELEVALPMNESDGGGLVGSAEVEKRVRELMDESEKRKSLRKRVMEKRDEAMAALSHQNGSSRVALAKLVESWLCALGIGCCCLPVGSLPRP